MRIRGNWASLLTWRHFSRANGQVEGNVKRISSGLRVNSAADDASGLSVSMRVLGQFKGLVRASRNAADGVSLINTAESALVEVQSLIQRGRELALQAANGTLGTSDRQMLQAEMSQLLVEIDRISTAVTFNGQRLLNVEGNASSVAAVLEGLRSGWLEQAESVIQANYGLVGDGIPIQIVLETSGAPAWISGTPGIDGKLDDLRLHINLNDFGSTGGPDGGEFPLYNDRKVARALTQAILARNSDFVSLNDWFISGVSDLIAGRDEQLAADVGTYGAAAVVNAIDTWSEDSLHQSSAYLATKYLESLLGPVFTMQDVMLELQAGNDLNTALGNTVGMDVAAFIADFKANGAAFLATLNLADADVGGVGGGDASGVIPNGGVYTMDPLNNFDVTWPTSGLSTPLEINLQIGANASEMIRLLIPEISTASLGLIGINLVSRAQQAIPAMDGALDAVSQVRNYLGSMSNRLEHALQANDHNSESQLAGYSRIVDVDVAQEISNLTRQQILLSTASAMLAQSNTARQHVMWLLKDLPMGGAGAGPVVLFGTG